MTQIKTFIVELGHSVMKTVGGKSLHKLKYNISLFIDNISKSILILVKDMMKFLSHFESIWLDNESEKGEFIILELFIRC